MEYRTLYRQKCGELVLAEVPVLAVIEPNRHGTPTWAPNLDWGVGTIKVSGHWHDHRSGVTVIDWIDLPDTHPIYEDVLTHITGECAVEIDRQFERALRAA